jgi:AcrR family transcriptional regulator
LSQSIPSADDDPILDAARATVLDFGVRRTTVSEVARRAGVSRMTVYRRYPDGASLLRALMAREFARVVEVAAADSAGAGQPRERLVAEIAAGLDHLLVHPVLRRLLEVDAELLLPYFVEARGRFQTLVVARLAELIAAGQRAGDIRAGDPERMAATLELALRGPVLAARTVANDRERTALVSELRDLADRYLRP